MNRARKYLSGVVVAAVSSTILLGCGSSEDAGSTSTGSRDMARVDMIFDSAAFVSAGQEVRIAGARVGTVTDVHLQEDPETGARKARFTTQIEKRFLPLRQKDWCTITPQSVIGERFVDCKVVDVDSPPIAEENGVQLVGLDSTKTPVEFDDLMSMAGQPTGTRFQLLMNELGGSLAGRGEDLNAAVRRSYPMMEAADKVLTEVNGQRVALRQLIEASSKVTGEISRRGDDLSKLFDNGSRALRVTSQYRQQVDQLVAKLPTTLDKSIPTLTALRDLARDSEPTLRSVKEASPYLTKLFTNAKPLIDASVPNFEAFAKTSRNALPTIVRAEPKLARLEGVTHALHDSAPATNPLLDSLQDNDLWEGAMGFLYSVVTATSRYDDLSHIVPINPIISPCMVFVVKTTDGCDSSISGERKGANKLSADATKRFMSELAKSPPPVLNPSGYDKSAGFNSTSASGTEVVDAAKTAVGAEK